MEGGRRDALSGVSIGQLDPTFSLELRCQALAKTIERRGPHGSALIVFSAKVVYLTQPRSTHKLIPAHIRPAARFFADKVSFEMLTKLKRYSVTMSPSRRGLLAPTQLKKHLGQASVALEGSAGKPQAGSAKGS